MDGITDFIDPFSWTEEEIHALVMEHVGVDIVKPRGFQVLVKIWMPDEMYKSGLARTDQIRRNERITSTVGLVLRMGNEAFTDPARFPCGARVTFNEWAIFRSTERQLIQANGHYLAFINDDRFVAVTTDPENIQTTFDLEYEHNG